MKKKIAIGAFILALSFPAFAGGILTNTNQHISYLRMIARGASIDIDGVYSNPAGLGFMDDGLYLSVNIQSAYQTRVIDTSFPLFGENPKRYEGKASAPVIPSIQALYKKGNWGFSGSFAITGGGGKASFNQGLAMFDSQVMAGLAQAGVPAAAYTISSAMDGKQYIFGFQLGASYRVNDYLSVFGGGRMNYVNSGYEGYLHAIPQAYGPPSFYDIELDCTQTGWGLTPIIGVDVKYGKWNLGLKYEFMANLNIENKTKTNTSTSGPLADYVNGVNTPHDIPAMLMAAVGYEILPTLRASVEYHQFFDKDAGMANDKQKYLTGNTQEFLAGIEWDVHKMVTISGGYQRTDYGLADGFQSDISFSLDSYAIGFGGAVRLTPNLTVNAGYFWTDYDDYTKASDNYNGLPMPGKDVLSRTNKVFGLGIDYKF
jgi:Long-chain fatty acid transport protein